MEMNKQELSEEEYLAAYDASRYPKPAVTVDVLLIAKDKILLIKRGNHPQKNRWALPGGFINLDEELLSAAQRELAEETGAKTEMLELIGVYGAVGRDPRDRIISVAYGAVLPQEQACRGADDAAESQWFTYKLSQTTQGVNLELKQGEVQLKCCCTLARLPVSGGLQVKEILTSDLAFDHGQIIIDGLLRLGKGDELLCAETI